MRSTHFAWMLLTVTVIAGCSSSEVAEVAEQTDQLNGALASTLPVISGLKPDGETADEEHIAPFAENLNFFTPPKMIIPIEVEPEEDEIGGELPPLRLVGFVSATGDKAMVAVGGKMHIVTAGKRLNGVEIVSVKSPLVELRWGETDLTMDFYKPSKTNRPKPKRTPPLTFSTTYGANPAKQNTSTKPKPAPTPRPQVSLPSLPGLPKRGDSGDADLADFPDLGAGPVAPPAP